MERLTKKEKAWVEELENILKKQPRNLLLFATGELHVLKPLKKGNKDCLNSMGSRDENCIVHTIICYCDGGDF